MNNPANPAYRESEPEDDRYREERAVSDAEDRQLIARALKAPPEAAGGPAFGQLYEKHREAIFRVLWGVLRNREDALDATQDVFIRVLRALGSFDPAGRFYSWIHRIAVNRGIDILRDRKRRRALELEPQTMEPVEDTPPESAEKKLHGKEIRERITRAMAGLSEDHRTVFVLYTQENMTYEEIGAVLDVPIGTVMSRLHHARKNLARSLPPEWDPGGRKQRQPRNRGGETG